MQTAIHTRPDSLRSLRPDESARVPWVVWFIAGMLVLSLIGDVVTLVSSDQLALELRLITFSVQLGVFTLIAVGLRGRHPLVHRLYLVLSVFWLVSGIVALWLIARGQPTADTSGTVVSMVVAAVLVFGLRRPAACAWFGLQCPRCSSEKVKAKSLGMRRLACKACDHEWDRRAPDAIDPTTFD